MRLVFIGGELGFCYKFQRTRFYDRWSVCCGLAIVQAAKLSLWFNLVLLETTGRTEQWHNLTASFVNQTDKVNKCLTDATYEYTILQTIITPYFYPFIIELTLLAGQSFAHMFLRCRTSSGFIADCEEKSSNDSSYSSGASSLDDGSISWRGNHN